MRSLKRWSGSHTPCEAQSPGRSLDADFKLQALVNLAVLEVAELIVDVVDFGFKPIHPSFDCRESRVDFRKFRVHVSSQVGDFLMHACEMRSQR